MTNEQQKPATPGTNPGSTPQHNQGNPSPQHNQGNPQSPDAPRPASDKPAGQPQQK